MDRVLFKYIDERIDVSLTVESFSVVVGDDSCLIWSLLFQKPWLVILLFDRPLILYVLDNKKSSGEWTIKRSDRTDR